MMAVRSTGGYGQREVPVGAAQFLVAGLASVLPPEVAEVLEEAAAEADLNVGVPAERAVDPAARIHDKGVGLHTTSLGTPVAAGAWAKVLNINKPSPSSRGDATLPSRAAAGRFWEGGGYMLRGVSSLVALSRQRSRPTASYAGSSMSRSGQFQRRLRCQSNSAADDRRSSTGDVPGRVGRLAPAPLGVERLAGLLEKGGGLIEQPHGRTLLGPGPARLRRPAAAPLASWAPADPAPTYRASGRGPAPAPWPSR